MATPKRVIIIGGGISGLATAYHVSELARRSPFPLEITVLEAKPRLGGVIETRSQEGFLLEGGPDSFISEKPAAWELSKRLAIAPKIIGTNEKFRRSFIYKNGKLVRVPEGFYLIAPSQIQAFLRTPLLDLTTKLRMGCELFIPRRPGGGDESVGSFVRRRFGETVLREVAQPMIGGIYTADPEYLSLEATLPQFLEMERHYGSVIRGLFVRKRSAKKNASHAASGPRYSLFLSYREGMETLTRKIVSQLPEVQWRVSSPVTRIQRAAGGWEVMTHQGDRLNADALCLALPAPQAAALLSMTAPSLSRDLAAIPYESVATVNLAYRRQDIPHDLGGFGFVVPAFTRKKIVACSFSSVKFSGRAPEGMALLRVFAGGALHREVYAMEDETLVRTVTEELRHYLGVEAPPVWTSISRYPHSMPQYQVGHLRHVASIRSQLSAFPGLYLAGNAYNGIGVPDCIKSAQFAADAIVRNIQPRSSPPPLLGER